MSADRIDIIAKLFAEATELSAVDRAKYLRHACNDDAQLIAEVESLLRHHDDPAGFMDSIPALSSSEFDEHADNTSGDMSGAMASPIDRIGRYEVVGTLGRGSSSVVLLARQESPTREVAIKLARLGGLTAEEIGRFLREAELLAQLTHPGIAQVYESGIVDLGLGDQPYLVMEHVNGQSLVDYTRDHGLSIPARLWLFLAICEPIVHAHAKGIIHRDLKPQNILVTAEGALEGAGLRHRAPAAR